mmetsp:Transcript_123732/g.350366  ORF Transcript_123732/g.350366 Transcript_123732/m.350366 type:complete len:202 (-) Transcript_123732:458-1063(-)
MEPLRRAVVRQLGLPGQPGRAGGVAREAGVRRGHRRVQLRGPVQVRAAAGLRAGHHRAPAEDDAPPPIGVRPLHLRRGGREHPGRLRGRAPGGIRRRLHGRLGDARDRLLRHPLRPRRHAEQARPGGGEGGEHGAADGIAELLRHCGAAGLHHDPGGDRGPARAAGGPAVRLHAGGGGPGARRHRGPAPRRQARREGHRRG